ncbi:MAG: hypothetical protein EA349_07385 [Halomonadaceae bacterium]|nr:MAG: hypothetical protein EA349_07385 [Halomonadaceae bacterium]
MMTLRTLLQVLLILAFAAAPLLQAAPLSVPVGADHSPAHHAGHEHHHDHAGHSAPEQSTAAQASHSDCHGSEGAGGSCSNCMGCGLPMSSSDFLQATASHAAPGAWQWFEVDPESEQRPPKPLSS